MLVILRKHCVVADAVRIDYLDAVAIGVVEIGVTPGKISMTGVLIQQDFDPLEFEIRHSGVKIFCCYQKGVVNECISPFIGWLVIAGSRQDEEVVASTHEDRGVVSPPIGAADHLDVKITCSFEIGNANREMAGLEGAEPLPSRSDIDSIFS